MRSPVYRHLGMRGGLLGVSPIAWMHILLVAWVGMAVDYPNRGLLVASVLYAVVRVGGQGRPDGFLQHWVEWQSRQRRSGGRLSAAARGSAPQFAFAEYDFGDVERATGRKEFRP